MNIRLAFLSILLLSLTGCSEKTEKKSEPSTPTIVSDKKEIQSSAQLLPDTESTIGNLLWHSNVKEAFLLAKEQDKNVIVMVGEDDCRWCVKMKKHTLTDARIQEHMQKYILVSVKRSDKDAIKHVPEFDGNIPSFFMMRHTEEVIDSVVGYFNPNDFLQYIEEIQDEEQ